MSSITRWDPFRDVTSVQDAMNQLMNQAVLRAGGGRLGSEWSNSGGQTNVLEAAGSFYCQVLLPGVPPEGVELTAHHNTLTIRATVPEAFPEEVRKSGTYLVREFGGGDIVRMITFPKELDADQVEARLSDGVLTLVVPVARHAQAKRIAIGTSPANQTGQAPAPEVVEERTERNEITGHNSTLAP
jgi:HSP20 family protein